MFFLFFSSLFYSPLFLSLIQFLFILSLSSTTFVQSSWHLMSMLPSEGFWVFILLFTSLDARVSTCVSLSNELYPLVFLDVFTHSGCFVDHNIYLCQLPVHFISFFLVAVFQFNISSKWNIIRWQHLQSTSKLLQQNEKLLVALLMLVFTIAFGKSPFPASDSQLDLP